MLLEFSNSEKASKMIDEIANDVSKYGTPDEERISHVVYLYKAMEHFTKNTRNIKISYEVNEPCKGAAVVTLIAKKIHIEDPHLFESVVEFANNFEVYPKTDGTVQMNFTFYGLLKKI